MLKRSFVLVAAIAVAATALSPTSSAAGPDDLRAGMLVMQSGVGKTSRALSVAPQVGWDAGLEGVVPPKASYYRLWDMKVAWRDVNPAPGVFDWSILDRRVSQAEAWGGRPLLVLGLTPQWAAADPAAGDSRWGAGSSSPPANIDSWTTYIRAVSSRYGNRIGAYELWNEANLKTFWTGDAKQMLDLAAAAYPVIKQNSPGATVLAPSVTTRLSSGGRFSADFLAAAAELPNRPLDALTIHSYPKGTAGVSFDGNCTALEERGETPQDCVSGRSPAAAAQQRTRDIRQWQQAVVGALGPDSPILKKPIWDTEVNYGLAGPGIIPGVDWTSDQGAKLMSYTFGDSAHLGIDVTVWYEFTASPYSLLGVQFTPNTAPTLEAWTVPARHSFNIWSWFTDGFIFDPVINLCTIQQVDTRCEGENLKYADLSDSKLEFANFSGADLYRANFNGSFLVFSNFKGARMFEATLNSVRDARQADFTEANLIRAKAVEANFGFASFTKADLRRGDFSSADFFQADLKGADLRNASLRNADLRNADLRGANLKGANIAGANLRGAKFSAPEMRKALNWPRATFSPGARH